MCGIQTAVHTPLLLASSLAGIKGGAAHHCELEMYVCDLCNQSFSTQQSLKRHRESVPRQSDGFSCRVCDRRFYRRDNLRKHHISKHADEEYEAPASYRRPFVRRASTIAVISGNTSRPTQPPPHLRQPLLPAHWCHQPPLCAPMHQRARPSCRPAYWRIAASAIGTTGLRSAHTNGVESAS